MGEQLQNMLADCRGDSRVHYIAKRSETDDYFVYIAVGQIFEYGGDEHDEKVGVVVEKERAHEITDSFQDEVFILSEVDGVDVGEGGGVSEHFDVEGADEVFLDLLGSEMLLGEFGLESGQLLEDDAVFLLLGFGFADALYQLLELFGEVGRCGRHY